MKWTVLMSLFMSYSILGSLSTITYNETAEHLNTTNAGTNTVNQGHLSESPHPGGSQGNATAAVELQVEKSKARPRILYVTNRTTDFMKHGQTLERRTAPSGPSASALGDKHQGGLRQTHDRRSAAKPSFETTRGKNWCAYVHTRLFPTVVIDSTASYLPFGTDPCNWNRGGCTERYRVMSRPTYRIKHNIVTSLEWKCCPGYLDPNCQPSNENTPAMKTPPLFQADEAEGQSVGGPVKQTDPAGRQQVTVPSVNQETAHFKQQTEMILTLQKQMTNASENMDRIRMSLFSLQGKLEVKERNYGQTTIDALKSKAVQEILRDIVKEEIEQSQSRMKETISIIFKTMSALSVDLQATKTNLHQINGTVAQLLSCHKTWEESSKQMQNDIQSVKNEISSLHGNAVIYANKTTHLLQKYGSLEGKLSFEQQKTVQLFNSINRTLSQMKGIGSNSLEGVPLNGSVVPKEHEATAFGRQMSNLGDTISSQALSILQLQQELHTQEMRMANLSSMLGQVADATFERLAEHRKEELVPQLEQMQGHIYGINQTLHERVWPMELTLNVTEERISHMAYDLEELKLLIEKQHFSDVARNDTTKMSPIKSQVEGLAAAVKVLNTSIINLEKIQEKQASKTQEEEKQVKETLRGCQDGIEDALNDTMTVINKAIDSVKDDYYVLRTNCEDTDEKLRKLSDDFAKKLESLVNLKEEINLLNSTVLSVQSQITAFDVISNVSNIPFLAASHDESRLQNFTHLSQKLENVLAQLVYHQRAIGRLQQANSSRDFGQYRMHLESLEVKRNVPDANTTSTVKSKKIKPAAEPGLAWKYKDLDKRLQALATKTFNLTQEVLRLRTSTSQTRWSCQNMSATVVQMQKSFQEPINLTLLQQDLSHFLVPESQAQNESVLSSSPTAFLTSTLNHILRDVSLLQKQAVKLDSTFSQNSTLKAGRNQRNTDSVFNQVEAASCSSGRCQNGGTCIDGHAGYVCACRFPFSGTDCTKRLVSSEASAPDFFQGSYRYAPMVTFFVAHTFAMNTPGPIRFNHLYVNYGASYSPGSGKFAVPYLGVYVFKYTVESSSPELSGYLVVDEEDKLSFQTQELTSQQGSTRVTTGDAVLELNLGQRVWLRLATGDIPARYPPVTTFGGYLLYRT